MAATFTTAGLDYILGVVPKGGTAPATLYLGLFSGGDGTTCPAVGATRASMGGSFAEASFANYEAVAVAAADWNGPATEDIDGVTGARVVTGDQKSFAAAGAADATANITGFFLATAETGGTVVYFSNFDDATPIASLALGDIIRVTPKLGLGNGA